MRSITNTITAATTSITTTTSLPTSSCSILYMYGSKHKGLVGNNTSLRYILNLDENIALLLVLMEERCLRGTGYSSIWAQPAINLVWSQSISITEKNLSRSQWWPCMVLAAYSGSSSSSSSSSKDSNGTTTTTAITIDAVGSVSSSAVNSSTTDNSSNNNNNINNNSISNSSHQYPLVKYYLPDEVMAVNMKRMPTDIIKELMKLRPKIGGKSCKSKVRYRIMLLLYRLNMLSLYQQHYNHHQHHHFHNPIIIIIFPSLSPIPPLSTSIITTIIIITSLLP